MPEEHVTLCRFCGAFCPIRVTVEDGRATRVVGLKENSLYAGYSCIKGRALPDQHNDPNRVLHTLVRGDDGGHHPIGVEQAMGGGDVKMMMMVGAFLGPWGVALTVFLGSVLALIGQVVSSVAISLAEGSEEGEEAFARLIPFGVFLAGGGGVTYVWGEPVVSWYLTSIVGL